MSLQHGLGACNNLHKIALAVLNYEVKYGRFPPAYTVDKKGRRMHSWRVLILEFLDSDLYAQYDFSRPWNSPGNLAFAKKMRKDGPYLCPSEDPSRPNMDELCDACRADGILRRSDWTKSR